MRHHQHPFSSTFSTNRAAQLSTQQIDLNQYINPNSERAQRAFYAHFQHGMQNQNRFEASYKTVMCRNWLERRHCNYGKKCRFAHGFEDLRPAIFAPQPNSKYKTRVCDMYINRGICPYGNQCHYIHPDLETDIPRQNPPFMAPSPAALPSLIRRIGAVNLQQPAESSQLRASSNQQWAALLFNAVAARNDGQSASSTSTTGMTSSTSTQHHHIPPTAFAMSLNAPRSRESPSSASAFFQAIKKWSDPDSGDDN